MFKYRAISFPILIALLAVMIFWPSWGKYLYAVIAGIAAGLMFHEAAKMVEKIGLPSYAKLTALCGGVILTGALLAEAFGMDGRETPQEICDIVQILAFIALVFHGWVQLLFRQDKKAAIGRMLTSAGIALLCGIPVFALALIYFDSNHGPLALFYVMMVTKSMDTGGYIFGMLSAKLMPNGNHKIVPSISPKKSWEGTIGGILFSIGVALLFYWFFQAVGDGDIRLPQAGSAATLPLLFDASILWHILAATVLAIGSFAGDLTESALKRACDTKDSGHWIPGMGGAFDVLDSFIYNGILFYLLTHFLRWI